MREVTVPVLPGEEGDWATRRPRAGDTTGRIDAGDEPIRVRRSDDGAPVMMLVPLPRQWVKLGTALLDAPVGVSTRQMGLARRATLSGTLPRAVSRGREACREAGLNEARPDLAHAIAGWATWAGDKFAETVPEPAAEHRRAVTETMAEEWRICDYYTTTITNRDSALRYHRDGGNLPGTWNAMAVWKFAAGGGDLSVPRFDTLVRFHRPTLVLFPAQAHEHGVTPITFDGGVGARLSCVAFAMDQVRHCLPPDQERTRARAARTERERRRMTEGAPA